MLLTKIKSATVALAVGMLVLASLGAISWGVAAPAPGGRGGPGPLGVAKGALPAHLVELWALKTEGAIESGVAIADGVVFAGSMDEHLYAVELATGKQKWKLKAGPIKAPPVVHKGVVYFGDLDGAFRAVDAARGKPLWKFKTGSEISGANVFEGNVLFACHDEHLYCLSSKTGVERWRFKTDGPSYASPAVADGKALLVGCDSSLHVIDIATGKEERAVDLGGQTGATAAVLGDQLYVGTKRNEVQAINWKQGVVTWTFKPGRGQGWVGSAAATDKRVVVGSRDNRVWAIDRAWGTAVWSFPTGGRVDSSPVIVGSKVVVGSLDGRLYVLDLPTGRPLQRLPLDGPIAASAVVVDGRVLIGTQKGTLYCLGEKKKRSAR